MSDLDPELLETWLQAWSDHGCNEYVSDTEAYHVLFESWSLKSAGEQREKLLEVTRALGLEVVDTPAGNPDGEIWVRLDKRIDDELENWA